MTKIFVIPQNDLLVTDPEQHDFLPKAGRVVESTTYWQRRINDGDVMVGEQKPALKTPVKPTKKDA